MFVLRNSASSFGKTNGHFTNFGRFAEFRSSTRYLAQTVEQAVNRHFFENENFFRKFRKSKNSRRMSSSDSESEADKLADDIRSISIGGFTWATLLDQIEKDKFKNIIILTGAGISTSAGIPDFRTKGTGLYDNLQEYNLPYAEAVFDISYFRSKPQAFYTLAKEIMPGKYAPTLTHHFIKFLDDKGILLRCYTQNIDGLERLAGLNEDKLVEAHGTFATSKCIKCHYKVESDVINPGMVYSEF
jgi:hypothetical protein